MSFLFGVPSWGAGVGIGVSGFSLTRLSNRLITPNGDGRNDGAAFLFSNPRASAGSIKIYSVRGHQVTSIAIGPLDTSAVWSPAPSTPSGVYIYVVHIEDMVLSGAVAVVK